MADVIVYKSSPYGLVFIHDKPLGFIIYHIKHERVYVLSYVQRESNQRLKYYVNMYIFI